MSLSALAEIKDQVFKGFSWGIPKTTAAIKHASASNKSIALVIPTYRPSTDTYKLVRSVVNWYPNILIVVVDDSTPKTPKNSIILNKLSALSKKEKNVTFLRTPQNRLKAGALNYGISYINNLKTTPEVVITSDDDVKVDPETLTKMVEALYSQPKIGAVCSLAIVKNKNKNILTRLQALEYHSFNISKIADNTFFKGPLVMQGMLTAFRRTALNQVKGFSVGHLIEDYDITVRLKNKGWQVRLAKEAVAWTHVPETVEDLWKQRVRWGFGGLGVVLEFWRSWRAVFQDLLGHLVFVSLFGLIVLSFYFMNQNSYNSTLAGLMLILAIFNFVVSFSFNALTLINLPKRDRWDFLIRLSLIPELIYCNILSLILLGSYVFFFYNLSARYLVRKIEILVSPYEKGLVAFNKVGYSSTWGTRES